MAPIPKVRFTVTIEPLKDHAGGSITVSEPSPKTYLLTFTSPPDNRITPAFITAFLTSLDLLEANYPAGVLITTSSIPKFYSNGLDLALAMALPNFMENYLYKLFLRLLTYPMPTIALVNGHCFAAGFMLAMHHDYRVFQGSRGFLCINEIEFGAPLLPPMAGVFVAKCRPDVFRHTALEARRWTAQAGLEAGLLDSIEGWEGVQNLIKERGLLTKGTSGVYGLLKAELYRGQIALLSVKAEDAVEFKDLMAAEKKRKAEVKERARNAKL